MCSENRTWYRTKRGLKPIRRSSYIRLEMLCRGFLAGTLFWTLMLVFALMRLGRHG